MGKSVRSVPKDRMSQAKLNSLIQPIEREHVDPKPILTTHLEYDTTHPDEVVRDFCNSIRNMLSRYQYNKDQFAQLEQQMLDLLHFIEMASDKNANVGFKLYKQLAEVRRQRRICRNEMDLLQPIFDNFGDNVKLNILAKILGECRSTKQTIDNRAYTVRTDVLDSYVNKGRD